MKVGITGHQNLGTRCDVEWISEMMIHAVDEYDITKGISCLAAGADQLFAEILCQRQIPYMAVVPSAGYEDTFAESALRENYRLLLIRAQEVMKLDFAFPSEEAFFAAGKYVVDLSDLVFTVWDGLRAKGLGGTGDIVSYAASKGKSIVHFDPIARRVDLKLSSQ